MKVMNLLFLRKMLFSLVMTAMMLSAGYAGAQTTEFKGRIYSLNIHDSLQPKILRSAKGEAIPVYASSTIFFNMKDYREYNNAAKYADMMESAFLDEEGVYTDRKIDTLDGLPVIHLVRRDESVKPEFMQNFYYFDDGERTYEISISGFSMDKRIMDMYFQVTKNSFRFDTEKINHNGISITLPVIMETFNIGFWTQCYSKDEDISIPVYANHLSDVKYEKRVKELTKKFKKLKPVSYKTESFAMGDMKATKYAATYNKKFKNSSELRTEYNYVIQHPSGGVFFIWYSAKPGSIEILDITMDKAIRSLKFL